MGPVHQSTIVRQVVVMLEWVRVRVRVVLTGSHVALVNHHHHPKDPASAC